MSQLVFKSRAEIPPSEREGAAERLRAVLPHLFIAANMAGVEARLDSGTVELAIVAKHSKGGRITACFEIEAFLRDLETLVGPLPNLDDV